MSKPKFDPNASFEAVEESKPAFDPNASFEAADDPMSEQQQRVDEMGTIESSVRGGFSSVGEGLTGGHLGEIGGAIEAGASYLNPFSDDERPFVERYKGARDRREEMIEALQERHPRASLGGEIVGGIANPLGRATSIPKMIGYGALYGAGKSKADLTEGEFGDYATDAGIGGAMGGVFGAASKYIPKATAAIGAGGLIGTMVDPDDGAIPGAMLGAAALATRKVPPGIHKYLVNKYRVKPAKDAAERIAAFERLGVNKEQIPGYTLTDDTRTLKQADALLSEGTVAGGWVQNKTQPLQGKLDAAASEVVSEQTTMSRFQVGEAVKKGVREVVEGKVAPISKTYRELEVAFADSPISTPSMRRVKAVAQGIINDPGLDPSEFGPAMRAVEALSSGKIKTIEHLTRLRTNLAGSMPAQKTPNQTRVARILNEAITKARDNSIKQASKTYNYSDLSAQKQNLPDIGKLNGMQWKSVLIEKNPITGMATGKANTYSNNGQLISIHQNRYPNKAWVSSPKHDIHGDYFPLKSLGTLLKTIDHTGEISKHFGKKFKNLPETKASVDVWRNILDYKNTKFTGSGRMDPRSVKDIGDFSFRLQVKLNPDSGKRYYVVKVNRKTDGFRDDSPAIPIEDLGAYLKDNDPGHSVALHLNKFKIKVPYEIDPVSSQKQKMADTAYAKVATDLKESLPFPRVRRREGLMGPIDKLDAVNSESIADKIGVNSNIKTARSFEKNFPKESNLLRGAELARLSKLSRVRSGPRANRAEIDPVALTTNLYGNSRGKPRIEPEVRDYILGKQAGRAKDLKTTTDALPPNFFHSGTPQGNSYMNAISSPWKEATAVGRKAWLDFKSPKVNDVLPKIQKSPGMWQKYGKMFAQAAEEGGNKLSVTYYMIFNSDPEFRKAMDDSE